METISRVPTFDGAKYEGMLNSAMQVSGFAGTMAGSGFAGMMAGSGFVQGIDVVQHNSVIGLLTKQLVQPSPLHSELDSAVH